MPSLTQQQKDNLAVFAGGWRDKPSKPRWIFPSGEVIAYQHWDPFKPEQGDLVLRALVNYEAETFDLPYPIAWSTALKRLSEAAFSERGRFGFWPAICLVALELIRQNKQEGV